MPTYDLIVIGGGILGSAATFFAARAGLNVALLEHRPSLAAHTTSKAVSCFRMQWDEPDFYYLMKDSIEVYEHFGEFTGLGDYDIGLRQNGWLFATANSNGPARLETWVRGQRALGVLDSEFLIGDEARARFPFLAPTVTAATFRARDGWLSPYEAATGFVRAAAPRASALFDTRATRVRIEGDHVRGVETTSGPLDAPRVLIAAGPHSVQLAAECGVRLPISLARRQRAFVAARSGIPPSAPMVADDDIGAYWRPESGGAFLGWGEAEAVLDAGKTPDGSPQQPLDAVPANPDFAAIVLDACARLSPFWNDVAPTLRTNQVSVAAGQYSITPDSKPLIGPTPLSGLYVLTGDNGFGIESAPQAARHLVMLMTGELAPENNPFRLDRPMQSSRKLVL